MTPCFIQKIPSRSSRSYDGYERIQLYKDIRYSTHQNTSVANVLRLQRMGGIPNDRPPCVDTVRSYLSYVARERQARAFWGRTLYGLTRRVEAPEHPSDYHTHIAIRKVQLRREVEAKYQHRRGSPKPALVAHLYNKQLLRSDSYLFYPHTQEGEDFWAGHVYRTNRRGRTAWVYRKGDTFYIHILRGGTHVWKQCSGT